jgi:hypothetical protein
MMMKNPLVSAISASACNAVLSLNIMFFMVALHAQVMQSQLKDSANRLLVKHGSSQLLLGGAISMFELNHS